MKRLLAGLIAALLSLGAAACEAPGAQEEQPAEVRDDERADTQLGTGEDAGAEGDDEQEGEAGDDEQEGEADDDGEDDEAADG